MRNLPKAASMRVCAHHPAMTASRSLRSTPRRAIRLWMPRCLRCGRQRAKSSRLVGVQLVGPTAWSAWLARDPRYGIHEFFECHRVVPVGPRDAEHQRDALPVRDEMAFAAELAFVCRVGPGYEPPGLVQADPAEAAGASTSCRCQNPVPRGRCSRGVPVRNTNKMPLRASSSFSRGRPPCGDFEPQAAAALSAITALHSLPS